MIMSNLSEMQICNNCEHVWIWGQDARHSCEDMMKLNIENLKRAISDSKKALEVITDERDNLRETVKDLTKWVP